ncbi:hypothetical protein Hanom_Chr06g00526231 [Helianthus anomalus]
MTSIQISAAYGARYPQEGDTAGDAPVGYVNMFADWFEICNLRLPLTVFMAELLEYYKIHISQLSPLGMVRARNFEYTFRALSLEPLVEDFRLFYQMTEQLGFFSFLVREGATKLMSPPKGITKWKMKSFYVKAGEQTWFAHLHVIASKKLENKELWILRMMLGDKLGRKARPVLREKNEVGTDGLAVEASLWRMFCPDFEGKIEIVKCGPDEEGWNETILSNFRVPDEAALESVLREGKGIIFLFYLQNPLVMALGDPDATGVPKASVNVLVDRQRRKKKAHVAVTLPPLVSEASGTFRPRLRKYEDYVVVSDTLEGLSVPGGSSGTGGAVAGTKPVNDKKNRREIVRLLVGRRHLRPLEEPVPMSTTSSSPSKVVDAEVQKKGGNHHSIKVVSSEGTPPAVHVEQVSKETGGDTIFDTLDSPKNLTDPRGEGIRGEKPKSPVFEKVSGSAAGKGTARARGLSCQSLQSQLAPMLVGDFIVANAIMEDYNALVPREEETIRLRAQAESMMKTAQAAEVHLEIEKAAFEKLKQTERWAASAGLEQVRFLAKLLTDEHKLWKEACARENEKLFRLCRELNNVKATNAALFKEKTATEVDVKEAEARGAAMLKEAEARAEKELADANADRTNLKKVVEELQAELKSREGILREVTSRATEAETRARQAEEVRDGLATSLAQVTDNHAWMRQHGIGHASILCLFIPVFALVILLLLCDRIVEAILDAP